MKRARRILGSVVMALVLLFAVGGTVVAEEVAVPSGVYGEETLQTLTPEMQYEAFVDDDGILTEKEQIAQQKHAFMQLTADERSNTLAQRQRSSGISTFAAYNLYRLPVLHFRQENGYYCGPATLKQTINYLSDGAINPSQSQLAAAIGTTTAGTSSTRMAQWLEAQGYVYYSVAVNTMTVTDISNYVYTDVTVYDNPPFGGISTNSTNWRYPTGGHLLNVTGIEYNRNDSTDINVELTDPYITYVDDTITNGRYFVSIYSYKNVMTSFWW